MVGKLAKNMNGERRATMPARPIQDDLHELGVAEARAAAIAPTEAPNSPQPGNSREPGGNELDHLFSSLNAVTAESNPRTERLLRSSTRKVAQKVIEEAGEVALAAVKHNDRGVVRESADLLYHLAVLWRRAGILPTDVWSEMRRRADSLGIAEKLPKSTS